MNRFILSICAIAFAACSADQPPAEEASAPTPQEAPSVPVETPSAPVEIPSVTIETNKKITSITTIPAVGHRGASRIIAAHGEDGTAIYTLEGKETWRDETPAKLVAFYQGTLIVYRDHETPTRLDRYRVNRDGTAELLESTSPSPIAATTIQRTAYAPLGPVRIEANAIQLQTCRIEMDRDVAALAAAPRMIPLARETAIIIGTDDGRILAAPQAFFADFGCE